MAIRRIGKNTGPGRDRSTAMTMARTRTSTSATQKMNTFISVGATLLGAFLGRKAVSVGNVGRATTAMRSASRIGKEKEDVARADESAQVLQERLNALQAEFDAERAAMQGQFEPAAAPVEKTQVRPRKSDITVGAAGLVWTPWKRAADGMTEPAF